MSKRQKAAAGLAIALIGQAYFSRMAKQQAAVLGVPAGLLIVAGLAASIGLA